jgi:hypothetical protein
MNFVAKTDDSGGVTEMIKIGEFIPTRICGQPDGTIWVFGRDLTKDRAYDNSPDANNTPTENDYFLLRQYSFEGGLLHGYLSRNSFAIKTEAVSGRGTNLDCGKQLVSLYFSETDEFAQVDVAKESVQRWKMNMSPIPGAIANGLAVLDNGCTYASLSSYHSTENDVRGLFVLRAEPGKADGAWMLIADTLYSRRLEDQVPPQDALVRLWGADEDNLVIQRYDDPSTEWHKVLH